MGAQREPLCAPSGGQAPTPASPLQAAALTGVGGQTALRGQREGVRHGAPGARGAGVVKRMRCAVPAGTRRGGGWWGKPSARVCSRQAGKGCCPVLRSLRSAHMMCCADTALRDWGPERLEMSRLEATASAAANAQDEPHWAAKRGVGRTCKRKRVGCRGKEGGADEYRVGGRIGRWEMQRGGGQAGTEVSSRPCTHPASSEPVDWRGGGGGGAAGQQLASAGGGAHGGGGGHQDMGRKLCARHVAVGVQARLQGTQRKGGSDAFAGDRRLPRRSLPPAADDQL